MLRANCREQRKACGPSVAWALRRPAALDHLDVPVSVPNQIPHNSSRVPSQASKLETRASPSVPLTQYQPPRSLHDGSSCLSPVSLSAQASQFQTPHPCGQGPPAFSRLIFQTAFTRTALNSSSVLSSPYTCLSFYQEPLLPIMGKEPHRIGRRAWTHTDNLALPLSGHLRPRLLQFPHQDNRHN